MRSETLPIPQEEGESFEFLRGYTAKDAMLFGPAVLLFVIFVVFLPELANRLSIRINPYFLRGPGIALTILLTLIAIVALITTPEYYTPREWVNLHLGHRFDAKELVHSEKTFDHANRESNEGQGHDPITKFAATTKTTQEVTYVEKVLPSSYSSQSGVVRLSNGDVVGAVRVDPTNLSLATDQEWNRVVSQLTNVINSIDHKYKINYTTDDFDVESYLEPFYDRLNDEDVQSSPVLEAMLRDFLDWYPQELALQGTKRSEFYVVVGVEESEVKSTARQEGIKDQLAEARGFSLIFDKGDEDAHETVIRGRQREELYRRISQVEQQIRGIDDVDAQIVAAEDHAALIAECWKREEYEPGGELEPTPVGVNLPEVE
jgi:hypothetical protein